MVARSQWGELLSEEPGWRVDLARKKRMLFSVIPILVFVLLAVPYHANGIWIIWGILLGPVFLFMFARGLLYWGMRVYQGGIEYPSLAKSMFGTWDRWLIVSDQPTSLRLRKVHTFEAATGTLDTHLTTYEKFINYGPDMTNFVATKQYIVDSIYNANAVLGQQAEYRRTWVFPMQKR